MEARPVVAPLCRTISFTVQYELGVAKVKQHVIFSNRCRSVITIHSLLCLLYHQKFTTIICITINYGRPRPISRSYTEGSVLWAMGYLTEVVSSSSVRLLHTPPVLIWWSLMLAAVSSALLSFPSSFSP